MSSGNDSKNTSNSDADQDDKTGVQEIIPQPANLNILVGVLELSDADLATLLKLSQSGLRGDDEQITGAAVFWHSVHTLLKAEQKRRRKEVVELERLYFMR